MAIQGIAFKNAIKRQTLALLKCQRMRSRLPFDLGPRSLNLWPDRTFEEERVWIPIQPIGEPAKPRSK
jgi:hypothetical protein